LKLAIVVPVKAPSRAKHRLEAAMSREERAALAITMAVQVVGTLLLFALVVTPAATALAQTAEPPEKIPPIDETELREAEERLGQMSMFDPHYDEAKQSVMVMRSRHDVAESRRASGH